MPLSSCAALIGPMGAESDNPRKMYPIKTLMVVSPPSFLAYSDKSVYRTRKKARQWLAGLQELSLKSLAYKILRQKPQ